MTDFDRGFDAVPPPPRPLEYADRDARGWWISVLGGIALITLGVWLLTNLFESVVVLAWLIGVSLIVAGIVEVMALHAVRDLAAAAWVSGALLVAAGIAVLVWPDVTLWAIAVVTGLALLLTGILEVVIALADRGSDDMPLRLGLGGLTAAVGALVLVWPGQTLVVLAILLGLRAIGSGLVAIGIGWQLRRFA